MDALFAQSEHDPNVLLATKFYAEDTEFHIRIARMSRNPLLAETVEEVRFKLFLPLGQYAPDLDKHANDHHRAIFRAIENQNPKAAAFAMRTHIQGAFDSLIGAKKK